MYGGYGSTSPPLTNNPFISDGGQQVSARFPDLSAAPQQGLNQQQQYAQQQQQWGNGMNGGGYPQQQGGMYQQQQPQMGYGQQQPQQQMNNGYLSPNPQGQQMPYSVSTPGSIGGKFQPSSSFGQQLAAHASGSSYGYLNGQQQPQSNSTAYTPAQQQLQSPSYVAQFDPYSSLGQTAWAGANNGSGGGMGMSMGNGNMQQQQQPQQQQGYFGGGGQPTGHNSNSSMSYGFSVLGEPHPKDFIRTHKAAIEAWDQSTWRQWIASFEALMRAWDQRKSELKQRGGELLQQAASIGGYDYQGMLPRIQQEGARLQGVSHSNFD